MSLWKFVMFYCVISLGIHFCWARNGSGITIENFKAFGSANGTTTLLPVGQFQELHARSLLRCLIACTNYQTCLSAIFNAENGVCWLLNDFALAEFNSLVGDHSRVYTRLSLLQSDVIINTTTPETTNTSSNESSNFKIILPDCQVTEIKSIKLRPSSVPLKIRCFHSGITIQENHDTSTSIFNKYMSSFVNGIGNVSNLEGKYMMSLNDIHLLTSSVEFSLEIKPQGDEAFKLYEFRVGNSSMNYRMTFSRCSYLSSSHPECIQPIFNLNGTMFSARNDDHDGNSTVNCASEAGGGFWYTTVCNHWSINSKDDYLTPNNIFRMVLKSNDSHLQPFQFSKK